MQIGLEHLVARTHPEHKWRLLFTEHSWVNAADGSSGFIDLVLEDQYRTSVLVVECKRVFESSWLFLVTDNKQLSRRHAKSWVTYASKGKITHFDFSDVTLEPRTPQSQYCVVDGQDTKSQPMLERIAANVVSSTEALAHQEARSCEKESQMLRIYFGVIVTTAKLQVCEVEAANISISDGTIANAKFSEVPYLRFSKQLSFKNGNAPEISVFREPRAFAQAKENTVFVVNSEALPDFLANFNIDRSSVNRLA